MHRRTVLLGTTTLLTAASGCATLSARARTLDVAVFNQTDSPYIASLTVVRNSGDATRSEVRTGSGRLDLATRRASREDIAPGRRAVVRYEVSRDDSEQIDESRVHYDPTDDGGNGIAFDIRPGGTLTRR